jgi:hypothetical protein
MFDDALYTVSVLIVVFKKSQNLPLPFELSSYSFEELLLSDRYLGFYAVISINNVLFIDLHVFLLTLHAQPILKPVIQLF